MLAGLNAAFSDEAINCYKQKTCRGGGKRDRLKHTVRKGDLSLLWVQIPVTRAHCWAMLALLARGVMIYSA